MDPDLSLLPSNKYPLRSYILNSAGSIVDDFGGDTNLTQLNGVALDAGAGNKSSGTLRITLANDDPAVVSLAILDDWDETDRAKVNTIVGQAGVAAGSGTVGANTQRVTLATDVALPAGTNIIGALVSNQSVNLSQVAGQTTISSGVNGALAVGGDTAAATTDAGAPLKVGGRYDSALPTLTNGQRGNLQLGTRGSLNTTLMVSDSTSSVAVANTNGDAVATSSLATRFDVVNKNQVFNGTTFDRMRTVIDATNSTGTGIAAAGLVAQLDDTSPTSITENQFGNLRMTNRRELHTALLGGSVASVTSVADSATSVTLLSAASPLTRREVIIENTSSARLYIKFGTTASTTDFTLSLAQNGNMTTDYQGRIDAIWATDPNDGAAKITEITG